MVDSRGIKRGLPLPRHIAIIMDGNGRWAKRRGLPRIAGHHAGVQAAREVAKSCRQWGIEVLTLYTFSIENWKRPPSETSGLMLLFEEFIRREIAELIENQIQLRILGRIEGLPISTQRQAKEAVWATRESRGLILNLALNYGGRAEIVDAVQSILSEVEEGRMEREEISEATFARFLYTKDMPDPDLLVRTGGEMRISNFLLYQLAYAEFWSTPIYWPDFTPQDLWEAIRSYQQRERRFGMTSEQQRGITSQEKSAHAPSSIPYSRFAGGDDAP